MKEVIAFLCFIFVGAVFFAFIFHAESVDDLARHKRDQEWLQFSMEHHCHIVRDLGFWDAHAAIWQCDNFQVTR